MRTLTYDQQIQARAARVGALHLEIDSLQHENESMRRQLAQHKDAARLYRLLKGILDAAPEVSCDWKRPTPPARYTVTEWNWRPNDGRTPERFEAALDAADRWIHGTPAGTGAPTE